MGGNVLTRLLDLLYPPKCVFCGKLLTEEEKDVCACCQESLPCRREGSALVDAGGYPCAVAFYYEEPVRSAVRALKFYRSPSRAAVLGSYIAEAAALELPGEFDAVTYAPVSGLRRMRRGYDQAELLARAASGSWGVPVEKTLRKKRNNPAQTSVRAREARRANVQGVYTALEEARIRGRRFLLIDDVCTTGSTLGACAQALMDAGAASVVCAALAGGRQPASAKKR